MKRPCSMQIELLEAIVIIARMKFTDMQVFPDSVASVPERRR